MSKVCIEKNGPVTSIFINRPEVRNTVDLETADQLRTSFMAFEADAASAVAVLSGEGGHFCAGFDLKALAGSEVPYEPEGHGLMGPTRMLLSKPVRAFP